MTKIKNSAEIAQMRRAGEILAIILHELRLAVRPGVTTYELDALAFNLCKKHRVKPAFLGFNGYPASLCASTNEVVVHGIPNKKKLVDGDILGLDMGVNHNGYYADSALTVPVGKIHKSAKELIEITKKSLLLAIKTVKHGSRIGDIGAVVSQLAHEHGFGVIRELTGHGIGKKLQEDPSIPNYGTQGKGALLEAGMTIAIEPMLTAGSPEIDLDRNDGWTIRTKDKSLAAHFEHTVLVTPSGCEILTKKPD
ncbi:MAG TPA: type I methionyl aminopeptidase [bacterium]|nr:type I methionyl aminopeptidase [bacterium]HOR57246.1 type I methionyl aminopeptidase [bacterium]HPL55913.1 type I methionyl aminopeptidase [bacterium]